MPAAASASISCAYTEAGPPGPAGNVLTVTASEEESDSAAITRAGDEIAVSDDRRIAPVACSGATPTVTNVDAIDFQGATGTSLTIDERSGPFARGASDEGDGGSQIEMDLNWDDDGLLAVYGVPGDNAIALGALPSGLGLDLDSSSAQPDVDATIENAAFVFVRGNGGRDSLDAAGGPGFTGGLDRAVDLKGRAGADTLTGGPLDDQLYGGGGPDAIHGGKGEDEIDAGEGRDTVDAGAGRDRIDSRDGSRDRVRCGRGPDRVKADRRDRLRGCERVRR